MQTRAQKKTEVLKKCPLTAALHAVQQGVRTAKKALAVSNLTGCEKRHASISFGPRAKMNIKGGRSLSPQLPVGNDLLPFLAGPERAIKA